MKTLIRTSASLLTPFPKAALIAGVLLFVILAAAQTPPTTTLRQAGESHHILIGAAAAPSFLAEEDYANILGSEFSQLQPENAMKFGPIHPRPDTDPQPYDFRSADALVRFAQAHNMVVRGHTLVWHNQVPAW